MQTPNTCTNRGDCWSILQKCGEVL